MKDIWIQKSWYQVVWALRWRRYSILHKGVYKELSVFTIHNWTGRQSHCKLINKEVGYLMQLNKEVDLANLIGIVLAKEWVVCRLQTPLQEKSIVDVSYSLSIFTLKPEEAVSCIHGKFCHSHWSEALRSLTWPCPCKKIHSCMQDITYSLHWTTQ